MQVENYEFFSVKKPGEKCKKAKSLKRKQNIIWLFSAIFVVCVIFLFISSRITVKPEPFVSPHLLPKPKKTASSEVVRKVRGYKINY